MLLEDAGDSGDEAMAPDLQKILAAGKNLLGLINDVLDLSKIEAGKMDLFLETFHIPELLAGVVDTIRPLAESNGNALEVSCPADIGSMRADVTKVRQALLNLLSNACKFTDGRYDRAGGLPAGGRRRRPRRGDPPRARLGHRHVARAGRPALPAVLAGRRLDHAQVRRHRAWA